METILDQVARLMLLHESVCHHTTPHTDTTSRAAVCVQTAHAIKTGDEDGIMEAVAEFDSLGIPRSLEVRQSFTPQPYTWI